MLRFRLPMTAPVIYLDRGPADLGRLLVAIEIDANDIPIATRLDMMRVAARKAAVAAAFIRSHLKVKSLRGSSCPVCRSSASNRNAGNLSNCLYRYIDRSEQPNVLYIQLSPTVSMIAFTVLSLCEVIFLHSPLVFARNLQYEDGERKEGMMARLRGKTGPRNREAAMFGKPSKAMVEEELASVGMRLDFDRVDVGQWNERREWVFVKSDGSRVPVPVSTFKGEKTNWKDLMRDVCEVTGHPWVWG